MIYSRYGQNNDNPCFFEETIESAELDNTFSKVSIVVGHQASPRSD